MELTTLKGIGEKTAAVFEKAGIHTVMDLLFFFPRDYETFAVPCAVSELGVSSFGTVRGVFFDAPSFRRGGKINITQGVMKDEIGDSIRAVWFNAPFMKDSIKPGVPYVLRGRISRKYRIPQLDQPKVYKLGEYDILEGSSSPIYSLTRGLSNSTVIRAMKQALQSPDFLRIDEEECIPFEIRSRYHLERRSTAVKNLHFPSGDEAFKKALERMAFEEIFLFIYQMKCSEEHARQDTKQVIFPDERTHAFLQNLPFSLTDAQKRVVSEIEEDMKSGKVMNRLVQGDVGSGKTIVALLAMMNAAFSGYQCALMAPTEVLAQQHHQTISRLFKEQNIPLNAALLTGSMTALEKKVVYEALADGRIHILIGTHALIQEKVVFKNLAFAVTDEQHRFGTNQRKTLAAKAGGNTPHVIVMSATPIPRTLALILYGDMDVSVIDQMPSSRKTIKNAVVDASFHENAYRFITNQVAMGHQAIIICPLVEYSDGLDAANAEDYTQMLKEILDPAIRIGKLTGPMSPSKKTEVMQKFAAGEIDVLVSTTVIEVGVDVPNATVMMVEDANRFGLAQLHQLRGRVGRGKDQSYCIFVSNSKSEEAMKRLEILNTSNNGFEIAAKDLELRGPGELLGSRQSGNLSFSSFDIYRDADLAMKALSAAGEILDGTLKLSEKEKRALEQKSEAALAGIML